MGANTLWRLASKGVDAIGFERFSPGHSNGSSHGDTRIFRTAYFEHSAYVPLLKAALPLWRDLERESGEDLLTLNGGLMIGSKESATVKGSLLSAHIHDLQHEVLSPNALAQRVPPHVLNRTDVAVYEPLAGYLRPERAVRAAARRAVELGARVLEFTEVLNLRPDAEGTRVITSEGEWQARRVVLCAGSWTQNLVAEAKLPLVTERQVMVWHTPQDPEDYSPERFPIWIHALPDGSTCYGFPSTDGRTVKLATHHGGKIVDPDTIDRDVHPDDITHVEAFVRDHLTGLKPGIVNAQVCMYTNTPDGRFAVGELPGRPEIVLVSACSGHGFKFASAIGEVAAELAMDRASPFDISLFDPGRLQAAAPSARGTDGK
jgi:sarcosine oxidase